MGGWPAWPDPRASDAGGRIEVYYILNEQRRVLNPHVETTTVIKSVYVRKNGYVYLIRWTRGFIVYI